MLANGRIALWFELSLAFCFAFSIWLCCGWLWFVASLLLSRNGSLPQCFWNMLLYTFLKSQARRQDSVTGGGGCRNKFWGGTSSLFCVNSRGARGHEKFIPVWIKWTRWEANIQRDFPAGNRWSQKKKKEKRPSLKLQGIFRPKSQIQAVFPAENRWSKKKKRFSSQKRQDIRCQSTKNTNLGLDLHSSSPDPVNFFGAQSSLGGAQFSFGRAQAVIWGGTAPACPPVAPGLWSLWVVRLTYRLSQWHTNIHK